MSKKQNQSGLSEHGHKVCQIVWYDAYHRSENDIPLAAAKELKPCLCVSYGEVVAETDECITLTSSIMAIEDGQMAACREVLSIPKGEVKKITELKAV